MSSRFNSFTGTRFNAAVGSRFNARGNSVVTGANGPIYAIKIINNELWVTGAFTEIGGVLANMVAIWNPISKWRSVGNGLSGSIAPYKYYQHIAHYDNRVYVSGYFVYADGIYTPGIAAWRTDTEEWESVGGGANDAVEAIYHDGTYLYAGGHFTEIGGNSANRLAKWNGSTWFESGGADKFVGNFATHSGNLYCSGNYTKIGGTSIYNIAKLNGSTWGTLAHPSGYAGGHALCSYKSSLYLSVNLYGTSTHIIRKYNGTSWSNVYSRNSYDAQVNDMVSDSSNLYFGGNTKLRKWDDTSVSEVATLTYGIGGSPYVMGMAIDGTIGSGGYLYVGGIFTGIGGIPASYIARWDGINWFAI